MKFIFVCPLFFAMLPAHLALAEETWPLTVKVLNTKNVEDPHGSFHFSKVFGNASAAWSHRIAEHVFVEASDGNSYELVPENPKDMLLPGIFSAKIEKRDMKVCEPKDNGSCRDVKFKVVTAVATVKEDSSPKTPVAQTASLLVESSVPNCDIEIDGEFVGNTPSTLTVASGKHAVTVKKTGYADWTRTMTVAAGSVRLSAEMVAK